MNLKKIPQSPGVYLFHNKKGEVIYIGKAANLKKRVTSYFLEKVSPKVKRIKEETSEVNFKVTETIIEALILEADLIKKHRPVYNIKEKDDRSFLFVVITKEEYERVLLLRGKDIEGRERDFKEIFGPFIFSSSIREALRVIRKIFPYNSHPENKIGKMKRPCLEAQIGLCPGTCVEKIDKREYRRDIRNIKLLFKGKKKQILRDLKKEMEKKSQSLKFEEAEKLKRQIKALSHIYDTHLIGYHKGEGEKRIEGYDISNIFGKWAVGSMVVFQGYMPIKGDYKRFKIKEVEGIDDLAMIREVLKRRLSHKDWPLPDLILIDGGKGQVKAAKEIIKEKVPVVGIAKGKDRKKDEFIGEIPQGVEKKNLIKVRDEAHRFALSYHRKLRNKDTLY